MTNPQIFQKYPSIVIEGPIGSGKTTLAKKLAELYQVNLLLEKAEENPFLERFYRDMPRYALPTQLHFLFQRAKQLQDLQQQDIFGDASVADFFIEKDPIFARINLAPDELELYQAIYHTMRLKTSQPDLVIYLQTPVEELLSRVEERNIDYEQSISKDYLSRLADAYSEFFHSYSGAPLLIVNNQNLNILNNQAALDLLIERILQMQSPREFFNPVLDD
jgi:deoxyadenosine/deoxycytidine kinase